MSRWLNQRDLKTLECEICNEVHHGLGWFSKSLDREAREQLLFKMVLLIIDMTFLIQFDNEEKSILPLKIFLFIVLLHLMVSIRNQMRSKKIAFEEKNRVYTLSSGLKN